MERVIIIGCGGAGKSTLARALGEKLDIPVVHLDRIFWQPGWVEMDGEKFERLHRQEVAKEKWIIDGNFSSTIAERIARCDTIIYLDFSRAACLMGAAKRIATTYGTVRSDSGEGCPERISLEFLRWVWNYNKEKRKRNYQFLEEAAHAECIVLKNRRAVKAFLDGLDAKRRV